METINSMASSAAKVIWGDNDNNTNNINNTATTTTNTTTTNTDTTTSDNTTTSNPTKMNNETYGQEPVSGKLGDTSKGEPFDAGNIETTQTPGTETSGLTGTQDTAPTTETTRETPVSKGPTGEHPSTTGDTGGFKAAQADIRDPDTSATTNPKVEAERKNVDDTGALDEGANPAKADGPGPKPIDEVARERGGDAANIGDSKTDGNEDDPEGLGAKSEKKGTGEQYVKTSGLQADGGDFDATKPGAGKEADRLLEEKGIQNPSAAAAAAKKTEAEDTSGSPDSKKEKTSLKDKIKAKLHKN